MSQSAPLPDLRSDQVEWLMVTANCLFLQQYPQAAATLLEFLLGYEPGHQRARQMLGYCYHLSGRHEESLATLDGLEPRFQDAHPVNLLLKAKALAALGRERDAGECMEAFSRTLEAAP